MNRDSWRVALRRDRECKDGFDGAKPSKSALSICVYLYSSVAPTSWLFLPFAILLALLERLPLKTPRSLLNLRQSIAPAPETIIKQPILIPLLRKILPKVRPARLLPRPR